MHIEITEGTTAEVQVASQCLQSLPLEEVKVISADKGYDSESLREMIKTAGVKSKYTKKEELPNKETGQWIGISIDCVI